MKKLIMAVTVAAVMTVGVLSVSAAELDNEFVSNMDAKTYQARRTEQLEAAVENGLIEEDSDDYKALLAHIEEVVETEAFGNGPSFGDKGDGNATCILGEDSQLGIFRSESAGMRTGNGNGVGIQAQDGTNAGNGNRRGGQGKAAGNGLQDGSKAGQGFRGQENDGVCVIAE